jgi:hypothetical protein
MPRPKAISSFHATACKATAPALLVAAAAAEDVALPAADATELAAPVGAVEPELTAELAPELAALVAVEAPEDAEPEIDAGGSSLEATTPPMTVLGFWLAPAFAAAAMYPARVFPLVGSLMTPTMPLWQWEA